MCEDVSQYKRLVSKLIYITVTRSELPTLLD